MPFPTPVLWIRQTCRAIVAGMIGACLLAAVAGAQDPGDPHLAVILRTAEETAWIATMTARPSDLALTASSEALPGGAATMRARIVADGFSDPSGNIGAGREPDFRVGNRLFRKLWVAAPASMRASDGLGPLYNARACQGCHVRDGRGQGPEGPDDDPVPMVLRVSVPAPPGAALTGIEDYLGTLPDPVYGGQLQDFATAGHPAEYRLRLTYDDIEVALSGGETARLRRPVYALTDLGYGPLRADALFSPRVAPRMIGLGLLEAIPAADILALADPDDRDGDGISGRPNIVWSVEFNQPMLGRFGAKAGRPTLREQSAAAFSGDMGLSSPLFPDPWGDCAAAQTVCRAAAHGDDPGQGGFEVTAEVLDLVTFYSRNLGVPARRDADDPQVLLGREVFHQSGCAACHQPGFVTHRLADRPEQSFQLIWPYTDMLLHDMGEALADHRPEARATGTEWRTAPLWGIGLARRADGRGGYLHDGRARSLLEAILWHGGEAATARDSVVSMPPEDRAALIRFLDSL